MELVEAQIQTISKEQLQLISSEQQCMEALFSAKWPDGFRCARCNHSHAYKITTRRLPLFECSSCHYQESLTKGTLMEGSRSDLRKWYHALLLFSHNPTGITALQLSAAIGVTYKTAWLILHKFRYCMGEADANTMLSGIVRVNCAMYGKPYNPSMERHPQEQPLLIGASVNDEGDPVYVKIKQVFQEHLLGRTIRPIGTRHFSDCHIEPDTDDLESVTARYSSRRFHRLLNVVKKAGQWINTTFHGIGPKYLQAYLNEYCSRLNLAIHGTSVFRYLIRLCVTIAPVTYASLLRSASRS
ncbi:transposase [Paenibacillus piri]|uniref:Transposase n=1 Tax=Paenibacillus piri TaxID=2547395 RepID=A0A4R5KRD3_9BACL|nr:transposase [Paenibacillus piri]TDF97545.1 transposase [Paenibacillus piri]